MGTSMHGVSAHGNNKMKILTIGDSTLDGLTEAPGVSWTRADLARNLLYFNPPARVQILPDFIMSSGINSGGLGGGGIPHWNIASPDGLCHWDPASAGTEADILRKWQCIANKSGVIDYVLICSLGYNDILAGSLYGFNLFVNNDGETTFRDIYDPESKIGTPGYDAIEKIGLYMQSFMQKIQNYGMKIIYVSEYPCHTGFEHYSTAGNFTTSIGGDMSHFTNEGFLGQGRVLRTSGENLGTPATGYNNSNYEYLCETYIEPWIAARADKGHLYWDYLHKCVPGDSSTLDDARRIVQMDWEREFLLADGSDGGHQTKAGHVDLYNFLYSRIAAL